jgi:hypothetical protein
MSEVEIPPADPGCCQWIEVVAGKRTRAIRMYRCGEPVADDTSLCRKHLLVKNPLAEFLRQQCKAPGAGAPGNPADAEVERLPFREPWPPGYDSGCDHD